MRLGQKVLLVSNTDWYLYNYRLSLARFLRNEGFDVVLASPSGRYASHLLNEGFRWHSVPITRRGTFPPREVVSLLGMIWLYARERPSVVHHFTIKPVLYGSLAAKISGVRGIVNSVTGLGYLFHSPSTSMRLARRIIRPFYRLALSGRNVKVIFENEADRQALIQMGLVEQERTVIVQGVGVDLDRYLNLPEPDGIPNIVMAGRMLWDKGVREFVEAARNLKAKGIEARFILVGAPDPGNPSTIPVSQIQRWMEEGIIEWWGHREDMPLVLAKSHVVTLPSYSEGLPTVLLEAAASGRPILATDIPGCRDVVRQGETGLLVPLGDQQAYEAALERLIREPELRRRMGETGRQWAESRFDQQIINEQTLRVYHQVWGQSGK